MIKPGPNILQFTKISSKRYLIYDVLKFHAVGQGEKEEIDFIYQVPIGNHGGDLIRELEGLVRSKQWVLVKLKEAGKMLAIEMIKELPEPRAFYDSKGNLPLA